MDQEDIIKKINLIKDSDQSGKKIDPIDSDPIGNREILRVLMEVFNVLNSNIRSVSKDVEEIKSSISKIGAQVEKLSADKNRNYFEADVMPFESNYISQNKNVPVYSGNRNVPKSISEMVNKVYDLRVSADYKQFRDFNRYEQRLVLSDKVNPAKEAEYITESFLEGDAVYINRISFFNSSDVSTELFEIKQSGLLKGDIKFTPCFIRKDGIIEKGKIG